jgi:hypothetical protein
MTLRPRTTFGVSGDVIDVNYVRIARHPRQFFSPQFSYRLLTPVIVHWLPVSVRIGFVLVTAVALAATAAVLFLLLAEFVGTSFALLGVPALLLVGAFRESLQVRYTADPITLLCIVSTFYLLRRGRALLLAPVLVAATLNHDANLALLVPTLAVGWGMDRFRPVRDWAITLASPLLAYVVLHYTPLVFGRIEPTFQYLSWGSIRVSIHHQSYEYGGAINALLICATLALGPLWAGILWLRRTGRFERLAASYLATIPVQCLVAADWDRLASFGFAIMILVCAQALASVWPAQSSVNTAVETIKLDPGPRDTGPVPSASSAC